MKTGWINETIKALKEKVPEAFEEKNFPIFPPKPQIKPDFRKEEFPDLSDKTVDFENPIFKESDEELDREIKRIGTDALAWYQPFHFYYNWGIYIRQRGIIEVARFLGSQHDKFNYEDTVKIAGEILLNHELFHFLSEWVATFLELYAKKPKYKEYAKLAAQNNNYQLEELLANAYAYSHIKSSQVREYIESFFSKQPQGYKDFDLVTRDDLFLIGKRLLGEIIDSASEELPRLLSSGEAGGGRSWTYVQLLAALLNATSLPPDLADKPQFEHLFGEPSTIITNDIPTYLVIEPEHPSSLLHFCRIYAGIQVRVIPGDHLPPHLHVWIPPRSENFKKIVYPEKNFQILEIEKLEFLPYEGFPDLTNAERKKLIKFLKHDSHRENIEKGLKEIIKKAQKRTCLQGRNRPGPEAPPQPEGEGESEKQFFACC
jgi:hypothetical protein